MFPVGVSFLVVEWGIFIRGLIVGVYSIPLRGRKYVPIVGYFVGFSGILYGVNVIIIYFRRIYYGYLPRFNLGDHLGDFWVNFVPRYVVLILV